MTFKIEGVMFQPIKKFFINGNPNSDSIFGYDSHKGVPPISGWPLHLNNYSANPDVYGIGEQNKVYLCQGKCIVNKKNNLLKNKIWNLVSQTISNVSYGNYIYMFIDKKGYINLNKNNKFYQEIISILKKFNIGLITVNESLQVDKLIQAKDQKIPKNIVEDTSEKIRNAIESEYIVKGIAKSIIEKINIKPSDLMITSMGKNRPSIYIYLDEWQKNKKISYFVKFLVNKVRIGINISDSRGGEFLDILSNSSSYKFLKRTDREKTKEIYTIIEQNYDELIRSLHSKRGQKNISKIVEELLKIIEYNNIQILKSSYKIYQINLHLHEVQQKK